MLPSLSAPSSSYVTTLLSYKATCLGDTSPGGEQPPVGVPDMWRDNQSPGREVPMVGLESWRDNQSPESWREDQDVLLDMGSREVYKLKDYKPWNVVMGNSREDYKPCRKEEDRNRKRKRKGNERQVQSR